MNPFYVVLPGDGKQTLLGAALQKQQATPREEPSSVPPFQRGDKAKREPLSWLWRDKIPLGLITLLVGHSELGKSTIACDIAARVTSGKEWPDGAPAFGPRDVVVFEAEDPADSVLLPRIEVAGGDLSRVHFLPMEADSFFFDNAANLTKLKYLVRKFQPALIIIDPLDDYMSRWTETGNNQSVRLGLKGLKQLTRKCNVSTLPILHLNKAEDMAALHRILGSVAFGALARSALAVAMDEKEQRYFGPLKASYADKDTALRYTLDVLDHPNRNEENPDATITRVKWGEECEIKMSALIEKKPTEAKPLLKLEKAKAFLQRELGDHQPHPIDPLKTTAAAQGISYPTLTRAKDGLRVEMVHVRGTGNCWKLPDACQ